MTKRRNRVRHYSRRSGVKVGSYIRGVKITDPRSHRARHQDTKIRAKKVYPQTAAGVRAWKKHRNTTDLIGVDTLIARVTRIRRAYHKHKTTRQRRRHIPVKSVFGRVRRHQFKGYYKTLKKRTGLTGVEEHQLIRLVERAVGPDNADKVDIESLVDSSLSYGENREILRMAVAPTARESAAMGYM
jgi:hypothetical protein